MAHDPAYRTGVLTVFALALMASSGPGSALAEAPQRVVSIGGSVTEILYDLHLESRIAAVDTTSLFPPGTLKDKPSVGYMRALSAEGVLSAKPDLVLALDGAGPKDALDLVRQTGTAFVTIPEKPSSEGVIEKINLLGDTFGMQPAAAALAQTVRDGFASLARERAGIGKPVRVLFVLSLQNGRSMVGGANCAADGIISLAGGVNAAGDIDGYKPITDEAITVAAPDVILTMQNGAGHQVAADTLFALPAYQATPAARTKAFVAMDGLLLLGFGPRTPEAARQLMHMLYPALGAGGP